MPGAVPAIPRLKFTNNSGDPVVSGSVTVYLAGSTTLATTYQDKALTIQSQNPVPLDANATALFWTDPSLTYKFLVKDALGVPVSGWPVDDIPTTGQRPTLQQSHVDRFSGNGTQTAFTLSSTPGSINDTSVYVGSAYQQKLNYSIAGNVLTFSTAPASGTNNIEVNYWVLLDFTTLAATIAGYSTAASNSANAAAGSAVEADSAAGAASTSATAAAGSATASAASATASAASAATSAGNTPDGRGVSVTDYTALRAYAGTAATVQVLATGIAGAFVYDSSDTTSADNGGTIIVAANGKRWKRSYSGSVSVQWFGAKGDGVTDDYTAIMAAVNAVTYGSGLYVSGPAVYFPPTSLQYLCNSTIQLKKSVRLHGDGSGLPSASTATIKWPAGVTGIVVQRHNTTGATTAASTTAGDASIIEGLQLMGTAGAADALGGHGVWLRARAVLRNNLYFGFAGNGINIVASQGGGGAAEGNANCFHIEGGRSASNAGHGLYVDGADVNAATIVGLDCSSNGGWGVFDSSFLGNTYTGCHTEANTSGPYKADSLNANNLFLGCYSEPGQPASDIVPPSMVVGGDHGAGFVSATDAAPRLYTSVTGLKVSQLAGSSKDANASIYIGNGDVNDSFAHVALGSQIWWRWRVATGRVYWDWANIAGSEFLSFYDRNDITLANGYARDLTGWSAPPPGLPLGYLGAGMRARIDRSAAPTTGSWLQGDIVWNTAPVAGGRAGWVCTAAGTPGTWVEFGTVAGTVTVASLRSPATAGAGARSFVSDATVTTFATVVAGGGANPVPVYSDGTSWRIG